MQLKVATTDAEKQKHNEINNQLDLYTRRRCPCGQWTKPANQKQIQENMRTKTTTATRATAIKPRENFRNNQQPTTGHHHELQNSTIMNCTPPAQGAVQGDVPELYRGRREGREQNSMWRRGYSNANLAVVVVAVPALGCSLGMMVCRYGG